MKIALDAMGGDFAPRAAVEGAVMAARELGLSVLMVGDRAKLETELAQHDRTGLDLTIEHAAQVVAMDDSPLESVLAKPESSIHVCYELLKRGEIGAVVGAGNSGAMMTAAMAILGTLPGVDRPAIASLVPSSDRLALLIDAGANTEAKPFNLAQSAAMGHVYAHHVLKLERPRVGILSNGEEDSKGTELTRTAAATLRQMAADINYIGYVEGRDINSGTVDVVVTDGFTGNVALKTMEGFAEFALGNLREVFAGSLRGKLAYLLARRGLVAMRGRYDKSEYGGAPLLGVNGVVIIAHGSSNARAIRNALRAAADDALLKKVNPAIVEMLTRVPVTVPAKAEGKGVRGLLSRMRERFHRHSRDEHAKPPPPHQPEPAHSIEPARKTGSLKPDRPARPEEKALRVHPVSQPPAANGAAPAEESTPSVAQTARVREEDGSSGSGHS